MKDVKERKKRNLSDSQFVSRSSNSVRQEWKSKTFVKEIAVTGFMHGRPERQTVAGRSVVSLKI